MHFALYVIFKGISDEFIDWSSSHVLRLCDVYAVGILPRTARQAFENYFADRAESHSSRQHFTSIDRHKCQVRSNSKRELRNSK